MAYSIPIPSSRSPRVVFLSSFVPRECGLATFTEDVLRAVTPQGVRCSVIAMNRPRQHFAYDPRVIASIQEDELTGYLAAGKLINRGGFDVLSIQHEYGIFGGEQCPNLGALLETVKIPVIATFHTVLRQPSTAMREALRAVALRADVVVVMNSLAVTILEEVYGIDSGKVRLIHHGAPSMPRAKLQTMKANLNLRGRQVISTFGLLSSGKGLEYAIQALPSIVARHPETIYLILGQTHPVVKQEEGECYRNTLKALARDLGVEQHVRFIDKYFTKAELVAFLMATDIYLTPYLNMDQITSGTLAYAMACGRPLVSTPYLYAQFLLGEDRGLLVPPCDPFEIADACLRILDNPDLKARMERANWRYGQTMHWPRVGHQYATLFQQCADVAAMPVAYLQAQAKVIAAPALQAKKYE